MRRLSYVLGLAAVVPGLALAQAAVAVEVRSPSGAAAEGRVSLTSEGTPSASYTCQTQAGRCTIQGVPGGSYVVRFQPADGGEAPEPRRVMIPPSGSATLRVSTH